MLRIAKHLPPGKTLPLSDKLTVQWYYIMYHRADCAEYVKSSKKLADETIETRMAYFKSVFAQRKNDGKLKRDEVDHIHNHAKRTLASDLCDKRESSCMNHERRESRERGQYNGHRLYCRGTVNRRSHDGGRSGHDGRDRRNNQPERGDRG
jgi:hypothetical protein